MNAGPKIAIGVGSVALITIVGFLILVGYYVWQFQFGETETRFELAQTFGTEFSLDASHDTGVGSLTEIQHPDSLIKPHSPTIGTPGAPITIIAFIDFECPYCRRAYATFEHIREKYEPVVRIVFKHYPLESIHPNARAAAIAAQCAAHQDKFWEYYSAVFEGVTISASRLERYADTVGLNRTTFDACSKDRATEQIITSDLTDGASIGVRGTPTYIVNGIKYEGVIEADTWDQIMLHNLQ